MRYAVPLSPFCRGQVRVALCDVDNPTAAQIADCLAARAAHFAEVLTGPSAVYLFADQRDNLTAWRDECQRGAVKARKAA